MLDGTLMDRMGTPCLDGEDVAAAAAENSRSKPSHKTPRKQLLKDVSATANFWHRHSFVFYLVFFLGSSYDDTPSFRLRFLCSV